MPKPTGVDVRALLAGWLDEASIASVRELEEGSFNAAWWIETTSIGPVVVKVAPAADAPCLSYEKALMANEVAFYEAIASRELPMPVALGHDLTQEHRWLAVTAAPGTSLISTSPCLEDRHTIDVQLGETMARLHQITAPTFGYGHQADLQAPTWPEALTKMFTALFTDADRFAVDLPVSAARLEGFLSRLSSELNDVSTAALVHFDLWDGNILTNGQGITVIDPERAFWGDPLAEFVSPALLADLSTRPGLVEGYRDRAGGTPLDHPSAPARLLLYSCYLYTIMHVESGPRHHTDSSLQAWVIARLHRFADQLDELLA